MLGNFIHILNYQILALQIPNTFIIIMLTYTCIIILVYSVMTKNVDANVVTQGEQICAYFKSGGKEQNIS